MTNGWREQAGFWRGKRVMITGVGGFVATHIAARLLEEGASVVGVVRDSRGSRRLRLFGLSEHVDIVHGPIEDSGLMTRVFSEYEIQYCFHLAAQAIVGIASQSPLSTFESNIRGTWAVMEAARHCRSMQGVVVASSDKVYGDQDVLPYTEATTLAAHYPYDASKLCADVIARSYAATYDLPVAVVRCGNIYGPGDLNWSRVVPGTVRSMLWNERPIVRSDGTLERDYLYVSDTVNGYLSVAQQIEREDVRGHAFNFGWGRGHTVMEVVEAILQHQQPQLEPVVLGQAKGEIKRQWLSAETAERVLGWRPVVELDEGIAASIDWYRHYFSLQQAAERVTHETGANGGTAYARA